MDSTVPSAAEVPADALPKPEKETLAQAVRGWVSAIGIAVIVVVVVRTFLFQPYSIPSDSMETTIMVGDKVIVSLLSKDPARGDIIVFDRPPNDPKTKPSDPDVLIKRVIGLPGETVFEEDGKVTVNGQLIDEPYLDDFQRTNMVTPITVPEGRVLVLGDNRLGSHDGRNFGPISKDSIVGRAFAAIWPINRIGGL